VRGEVLDSPPNRARWCGLCGRRLHGRTGHTKRHLCRCVLVTTTPAVALKKDDVKNWIDALAWVPFGCAFVVQEKQV
jgi:hypothetical protein